MKVKTLAILIVIGLALIMFTGWMQSMSPPDVRADAVNAENLIFTYVDSSDTNAAGDSVLTVSAITTADEVRFAFKMDMMGSPGDSVMTITPYTDSLTVGAGIITPTTWTYGDDYLIIWRDLNP